MLNWRRSLAPLAILLCVHMLPARAEAQARSIDDLSDADANRLFEVLSAGDAARESDRCGEAILHYREALSLLDADAIRFSLAECLERSDVAEEAADELRHALDSADADVRERAASEIERLVQEHPATLTLVVDPPDAVVTIDAVAVWLSIDGRAEIALRAGEHELVVESPGYAPDRRTLVATMDGVLGERVVLVGALSSFVAGADEAPAPAHRRRTLPTVLTAVAGGAAVGGVAASIAYRGAHAEWEDFQPTVESTASDRERLATRTERDGRIANICFAVAGVTGVAAVVSWVVTPSGADAEVSASMTGDGARVRVSW